MELYHSCGQYSKTYTIDRKPENTKVIVDGNEENHKTRLRSSARSIGCCNLIPLHKLWPGRQIKQICAGSGGVPRSAASGRNCLPSHCAVTSSPDGTGTARCVSPPARDATYQPITVLTGR